MLKKISFSINFKIQVYFIFLIFLILISFGQVESIRYKEKQYSSVLILASANKALAQRISFLSARAVEIQNFNPVSLKKTINEYEHNLTLLRTGGEFQTIKSIKIPVNKDIKALNIINKIELKWNSYKNHIENLQKFFIEEKNNLSLANSQLPDSIKTDVNYLTENGTIFLKDNDKLYRYYTDLMLIARKKSDRARMWYLIINIFALFAGLILAKFYFFDPVKKIKIISNEISQGIFTQKLYFKQKDEFGSIAESINRLLLQLDDASKIIEKLSTGNLNVNINVLGEKDILNTSLLRMRDKFKKAKAEEEAHSEMEKQRIWTSTGMAKFSELLRNSYVSIEEMSYEVLKFIIEYITANQGGIFLLNEEHSEFNLIAFHGYSRRKYIKKSVLLNEGLIGQCAMEQKTVYMTDIPDEYITVTSGLGNGNPKSLLLVPIIYDEKVIGVLELASFNEIENYKIKLMEDISLIYASTLTKIKVKINTDKLLKEAQEQSERLSQQDEELRQNLEEMQSTQEETERREHELNGLFNAINYTLGTYEIDLNGRIINANSIFAKWIGFRKPTEIIGKKYKQLAHLNYNSQDEYDKFWNGLQNGLHLIKETHYFANGKDIWFNESFTPVKNEEEKTEKILVIVLNITLKKIQEEELKNKIKEIKANDETLKTNMNELSRIKKMLEIKEQQQQNEIKKLTSENETRINQLIKREFAINKILEKSLNAVITFNEKGNITFSNLSSQQLIVELTEDLTGKNIKDFLILNYTFDTFFEKLKTLNKSKTLNFATNIKNKKGTLIPVEIVIIESKLNSDNNYTMFIKDVYNEKRFESERNELMEEFALYEAFYKNRIYELERILAEENSNTIRPDTKSKNKLIHWDKTYELGIKSIDKQHKKLIDLANKLYAGLQQKKGKEIIITVFNGLIDYTKQHFSFEEEYFSKFNFPEQNRHQKSHQKFIDQIETLKTDFKNDDVKVYSKTMSFIQEWIKNHILISDKEYIELFKNKGLT